MNTWHLRTNRALSTQQMDRALGTLGTLAQMTKWFNNGREPPQRVLDRIVTYFHRRARPLYLGQVALEIGYSLDQTTAMMQALQDAGVVRPLNNDEKRACDIEPRGDVWCLVDGPHPSKANW